MVKTKVRIKLFIFFLIFLQLSILFFSSPVSAKADDLIIDDNGSVTLIITGNSTSVVMGTSTTAPTAASNAPAPATAAHAPATTPAKPSNPVAPIAPKVVPVAPANSNTTVKIAPSTTDSKKLNITIQTTTQTATTTSTPAPVVKNNTTPLPVQTAGTTPIKQASSSPSATSTPLTPSPIPANVVSTQKTVDNVILRNAEKQPVLTIQPDQNTANQISIEQQGVKVSTNLPLQIDSKTHVVSVDTPSGPQSISILPDQAVRGANDKITTSSLKTLNSKVSLTTESNQPEYVVSQTKQGKLLGIFQISLPSQVKISAKTGKVLSVWQSPLSFIPGLFTK